jgi:hypothetical protein
MRCFSSSIAILELSYVNVRDWWDYPSFYPKCQQPEGWRCKLESAARPTVVSQDTGMAMTLTGCLQGLHPAAVTLTGPSSPKSRRHP